MLEISHEEFIARANGVKSLSDVHKLSKQISQLIARSWLPEGEGIRSVLLTGDSKRIYQLLEENGIDVSSIIGENNIEVDWSSFVGSLKDGPHEFTMVIGYPPRPSEFNLTDEQLKEWIYNDNPEQKFPPTPYIPATW